MKGSELFHLQSDSRYLLIPANVSILPFLCVIGYTFIGEDSMEKAMKKRENFISWDEYFMGIAILSGKRSKDPNTQVA